MNLETSAALSRDTDFLQKTTRFFLVVLFLSIPLSIAGDDFAVIGLYLVAIAAWIKKKDRIPFFWMVPGFALYLFGVVFSGIVNTDLLAGFTDLRDCWRFGLPFLLYYLFLNDNPKRYLYLLLAASSAIGLYAMVQFFTGVDVLRSAKLQSEYRSLYNVWFAVGAFSHHLTFGGVCLVIFSLLFPLSFCTQFLRNHRILFFIGGGINFIALVMTMGRSNWLGALVSGVVMFFFLIKRKVLFLALALVLLAGLLFAWNQPSLHQKFIKSSAIGERLSDGFSKSFNQDRLLMWYAGIQVIQDHPLFGLGRSGRQQMQPYYKSIEKEYKHLYQHSPTVGVHNIYLQNWIDYGSIGFLGFLAIWILLFAESIFAMTRTRTGLTRSMEKILLVGTISGFCGILTAGFFENNFRDGEVQVAILVAMGFALSAIGRLKSS